MDSDKIKQVVNIKFVVVLEPKKKNRKSEWETNWVYQDMWTFHFCWLVLVQATNGQLKIVYCKVCTNIESMEKPLMLSLIH